MPLSKMITSIPFNISVTSEFHKRTRKIKTRTGMCLKKIIIPELKIDLLRTNLGRRNKYGLILNSIRQSQIKDDDSASNNVICKNILF